MPGNGKRVNVVSTDYYLSDQPTQFNNPFVKIIFNFFAILLLGKNFSTINNGYFTSVIMFSIPILLSYLSFMPLEQPRRVIKRIQLFLLFAICAICIMGLFSIVYIVTQDNIPRIVVQADYFLFGGISFPVRWLLLSVWISFFLSCIDPFAAKTRAEQKINGYAVTTTSRSTK